MTERAPTIASQEPQGLWEFVSAFGGSLEMEVLICLIVAGILGQGASYFVKWARKEIAPGVIKYLFIDNPQTTALTFIGYISLMIGAIAMGAFTGENDAFVGWKTVLWFGLVNGFALDAAVNKGETKVFTQAERVAVRKDIKAKKTVPKK